METLGIFNYTPNHVEHIQNEIKAHLGCDNILSEYIIVMVRNNKTKKDVITDLSDFLGSDKATSFAGWLWNYIVDYFNQMKQEKEKDLPQKPTSRLILNAVKQASDDTKNIVPSSSSTSDAMEMGNDSENDRKLNERNEYNNHNNRQNRDKRNRNNNNNSSPNNSHTNFTVTINTDTLTRKRKSINRDDDVVEKTNSGTTPEDGSENNGGDDDIDIEPSSSKKSKKERCQFWPSCRNGDSCPYHHPTTQCTNFPNCPFGNKCLYIHPSIPCKYGANCTNLACLYNHPQRFLHGTSAMSAGAEIPCRFGFACPNKKTFCQYFHPPIACKFGDSCTNGRACIYGHGKPCLYGASCVVPSCTFAHHLTPPPTGPLQIECRYQKDCTNPNCKYLHTERDAEKLSTTLPSTPPPESSTTGTADVESKDVEISST
eukprot:gene5256-6542_t